jgi:hypothetical protein
MYFFCLRLFINLDISHLTLCFIPLRIFNFEYTFRLNFEYFKDLID